MAEAFRLGNLRALEEGESPPSDGNGAPSQP
jgi:hypothetical protein